MLILTFDIEDWFHTHQNRNLYSGYIWDSLPSTVVKNTHLILDLLDETGVEASFFILGRVAEKHPKLIKDIFNRGHEIAAHSNWHHNPNLLSPDDFEKDLKLNLNRLEDLCGKKIEIYRAPGFSLRLKDKWAFDILADNGIKVDSSVKIRPHNGHAHPFEIHSNNNTILEFPLISDFTGLAWTGGGYLRALPDILLDKVFKPNRYQLLYLHPRDFDTKNPYTNLFSFTRNLMNSFNTASCEEKLKYLLGNHETYCVGEYYDSYLKQTKRDV